MDLVHLMSYFLAAFSIALAIPVAIFFVEIIAALVLAARRQPSYPNRLAQVAVVIPAHNESSGIASALAVIRPQLKAGDRVLVIADNCTDDTASVSSRCRCRGD